MSKYAPHHRSVNNARATSSTICQKCLGTGHFTYQCKNPRPYRSRPSRTAQLENPKALSKLKADGKPSVEIPEEFKTKNGTANKILEAREKQREKGKEPARKKAKRSSSGSDSDSDTSSSSDSDSDSSGSSSSSSGSESDTSSVSRDRRRRVPRQNRSRSGSYSSDDSRGRR